MTRVPIAPASPPGYPGGMHPGCPPRASPSSPQQFVGDGSAWSYVRQMYRSSPHAAQAVEAQPLPTSAGVSEPSLYQHSHSPPHYQWAAGSAAGASTSLSNAGAYPAIAVNTGSGAPVALMEVEEWARCPTHNHPLNPGWSSLSAKISHPSLSST